MTVAFWPVINVSSKGGVIGGGRREWDPEAIPDNRQDERSRTNDAPPKILKVLQTAPYRLGNREDNTRKVWRGRR